VGRAERGLSRPGPPRPYVERKRRLANIVAHATLPAGSKFDEAGNLPDATAKELIGKMLASLCACGAVVEYERTHVARCAQACELGADRAA
jgi:hypothetical protein